MKSVKIILLVLFSSQISYGQGYRTFIDIRDDQIYNYVYIGDQTWMADNLKYKPSSGDFKPANDENKNIESFGYMYSWKLATQVCPEGWHLPSDSEWKELEKYIGMSDEQINDYFWRGTGAMKLKEEEYSLEWNGINSTGFSALPAGFMSSFGYFTSFGDQACWWTSTLKDNAHAWIRQLSAGTDEVYRGGTHISLLNSVRCIRDE